MIDITTITSAISGLKSAKDLVAYLKSKYDDAVVIEKVDELKREISAAYDHVIAVQGQYLALAHENHTLREKMREVENWDLQIVRYKLFEVEKGRFAYQYAHVDGQEPPHYICARCVQDRKKSILQLKEASYTAYLECHNCNTSLQAHNLYT